MLPTKRRGACAKYLFNFLSVELYFFTLPQATYLFKFVCGDKYLFHFPVYKLFEGYIIIYFKFLLKLIFVLQIIKKIHAKLV